MVSNKMSIFNADEFGLFYCAMPEKKFIFLIERKFCWCENSQGISKSLFCLGMKGEKLKILVIGKSAKTKIFKVAADMD